MITLWIILSIIGFIVWTMLIIYGYNYCQKNNAIGIFLLFIALNVFGLVLGWTILLNNKKIEEGTYLKDYNKIKKDLLYKDKIKTKREKFNSLSDFEKELKKQKELKKKQKKEKRNELKNIKKEKKEEQNKKIREKYKKLREQKMHKKNSTD